jgi:DNA-binding transcriptional ArsR family regulator
MPVVRKGRVREAILSLLSRQPRSASELSNELGVAKSTISYHLSCLLEEGLIVITSVTPVRGKAVIKKYSVMNYMENQLESDMIRKMVERIERERLTWSENPEDLRFFLMRLLFHSLRYLCDVNSIEHASILERVGRMVGKDDLSQIVSGNSLKSVLASLFRIFSSYSISIPKAVYDRSGAIVAFSDFLDSFSFDSRLSSFLKGLLTGVLEAKLGQRYSVSESASLDSLGMYNYNVYRGNKKSRQYHNLF